MAHKRCLFHLSPVCLSESEYDHRVAYGVFQKQVSSSEELVRSSEMGKLMGKFPNREQARDKIQELAKPYGEFAIFE